MERQLKKTYRKALSITRQIGALLDSINSEDELFRDFEKLMEAAKNVIMHALLIDSRHKSNPRTFNEKLITAEIRDFVKRQKTWMAYSDPALMYAWRTYCFDEGLCEFDREAL